MPWELHTSYIAIVDGVFLPGTSDSKAFRAQTRSKTDTILRATPWHSKKGTLGANPHLIILKKICLAFSA